MLHSLHGIGVPLVTPMHHGEIDLSRLQKLADHLIAREVHGLVVCGTTGEAPQRDLAEQSAVPAAVLETAHKRCPVPMGIGGSDTRSAAARELFQKVQPIIKLLFSEPNPAPLKAALAMQGWLADELRLPMVPASAACRQAPAGALEQLEAA